MEQMEGREKVGGSGLPVGRKRIGSFGIIEEILKRKSKKLEKSWSQEREQEVFQKSKETGRSPVRGEGMEQMIEEIRDSLRNLRKEIRR